MEEEQNNEYILELEKLMNSEVALTKWAPTMDILAIVTFSNLVEGYRISFKAQRFFQIEESQNVNALCFSPDSQLMAYSLCDGSMKLIKVENGEKVVAVENLACGEIKNINFLPFCRLDPSLFMPFTKSSIENKLILNISPHNNCDKNAIIKINYFKELEDNFSCLLLSNHRKSWLFLNGFIPVAEIDYAKYLPTQNPFRVIYAHLDAANYHAVIAEEVESTYSMSLLTFDTSHALNSYKFDIVKYGCLLANVTEILNFVETTYGALEGEVRTIMRQYNSKMNLIDDSQTEGVVPYQQLFRYLTIGLASPTLINFFSKEVYDSKILQKLDETLTAQFAQLHDIMLESVQNSLERATLFIEKLINYSCVHNNRIFNINKDELNAVKHKINRLYTLGQMLLVESTEAKFNIRNLLVWLNKATIKNAQENQVEIENIKSYLNRYTVDYNRLHSFLSNEDVFKLQNLLTLFRKTEDAKSIFIPPADFTLLETGEKKKPTEQQQESFRVLEALLDVGDVELPASNKKIGDQLYYSFKYEVKQLKNQWSKISSKTISSMSQLLTRHQQISEMGRVTISQLFEFQLQSKIDEGILYLYYINREDEHDKIIQFNCSTKHKSYVYTSQYHILSFSVATEIIAVLESKMGGTKIIGQISNQEFDGSEIRIGRRISNCDQGDLDISCSLRGLNNLVVDKTKLVIFD